MHIQHRSTYLWNGEITTWIYVSQICTYIWGYARCVFFLCDEWRRKRSMKMKRKRKARKAQVGAVNADVGSLLSSNIYQSLNMLTYNCIHKIIEHIQKFCCREGGWNSWNEQNCAFGVNFKNFQLQNEIQFSAAFVKVFIWHFKIFPILLTLLLTESLAATAQQWENEWMIPKTQDLMSERRKVNFSWVEIFYHLTFQKLLFNLISFSFAVFAPYFQSKWHFDPREKRDFECCKIADSPASARRKIPFSLSSFNVNVNVIKINFSRSLERREES